MKSTPEQKLDSIILYLTLEQSGLGSSRPDQERWESLNDAIWICKRAEKELSTHA